MRHGLAIGLGLWNGVGLLSPSLLRPTCVKLLRALLIPSATPAPHPFGLTRLSEGMRSHLAINFALTHAIVLNAKYDNPGFVQEAITVGERPVGQQWVADNLAAIPALSTQSPFRVPLATVLLSATLHCP